MFFKQVPGRCFSNENRTLNCPGLTTVLNAIVQVLLYGGSHSHIAQKLDPHGTTDFYLFRQKLM
jgi:hypothetical protein